MSVSRDGLLALVVFLVFVALFLVLETSLSGWALVIGGGGTLAFEGLAARHQAAVRTVWERPNVQAASLVAGVCLGVIGAFLAPRYVLAAGIGALGTYLVVLGVASLVNRHRH